jgi:hypothetical protein
VGVELPGVFLLQREDQVDLMAFSDKSPHFRVHEKRSKHKK